MIYKGGTYFHSAQETQHFCNFYVLLKKETNKRISSVLIMQNKSNIVVRNCVLQMLNSRLKLEFHFKNNKKLSTLRTEYFGRRF